MSAKATLLHNFEQTVANLAFRYSPLLVGPLVLTLLLGAIAGGVVAWRRGRTGDGVCMGLLFGPIGGLVGFVLFFLYTMTLPYEVLGPPGGAYRHIDNPPPQYVGWLSGIGGCLILAILSAAVFVRRSTAPAITSGVRESPAPRRGVLILILGSLGFLLGSLGILRILLFAPLGVALGIAAWVMGQHRPGGDALRSDGSVPRIDCSRGEDPRHRERCACTCDAGLLGLPCKDLDSPERGRQGRKPLLAARRTVRSRSYRLLPSKKQSPSESARRTVRSRSRRSNGRHHRKPLLAARRTVR